MKCFPILSEGQPQKDGKVKVTSFWQWNLLSIKHYHEGCPKFNERLQWRTRNTFYVNSFQHHVWTIYGCSIFHPNLIVKLISVWANEMLSGIYCAENGERLEVHFWKVLFDVIIFRASLQKLPDVLSPIWDTMAQVFRTAPAVITGKQRQWPIFKRSPLVGESPCTPSYEKHCLSCHSLKRYAA